MLTNKCRGYAKLSHLNQTLILIESKDFCGKNKKLNIQIPKFQRIQNIEKVNEIYKHYQTHGEQYFQYSPPMLLIHFKDEYFLYDGQHRFECLKKIYQQDKKTILVPFNIFTCKNQIEIQDIITSYNKSLNVPEFLLDMNNNINMIYVNIRDWLKKEFPNSISKSRGNTGNKINPDIFVEKLKKIDFIKKYITKHNKNDFNSEFFINLINNLNEKYIDYFYENEYEIKSRDGYIHKKVKSHLKKRNFILGIKEIKWLDNLLNNEPIKIESEKYKKKVISKKLRNNVWKKTIGNHSFGKCQNCEKYINKNDSWHVSHIISEINGGKTILQNLTVLCPKCNLTNGSKNMKLINNSV